MRRGVQMIVVVVVVVVGGYLFSCLLQGAFHVRDLDEDDVVDVLEEGLLALGHLALQLYHGVPDLGHPGLLEPQRLGGLLVYPVEGLVVVLHRLDLCLDQLVHLVRGPDLSGQSERDLQEISLFKKVGEHFERK